MNKMTFALIENMITSRVTRAAAFSTALDSIQIIHDPVKQTFYADILGDTAYLNYNLEDKTIDFYHTEVPDVFRGKGVAKLLATKAFEFAHGENFNVILSCDYLNRSYTMNRDDFPKLKIINKDI